MTLFDHDNNSGAEFSECGKYRYMLWRIWDITKPFILFIGLNPSTANGTMDDATIRRVKKFATDWGYGGVYMANLFALVSKDPEELKKCADPVGDNDTWLTCAKSKCRDVLFAWGSFAEAEDRAAKVVEMFDTAVCLGLNKNGTPKHPLYIKKKQKHVNFK